MTDQEKELTRLNELRLRHLDEGLLQIKAQAVVITALSLYFGFTAETQAASTIAFIAAVVALIALLPTRAGTLGIGAQMEEWGHKHGGAFKAARHKNQEKEDATLYSIKKCGKLMKLAIALLIAAVIIHAVTGAMS